MPCFSVAVIFLYGATIALMARRMLAIAGVFVLATGTMIGLSTAWRAVSGSRPFDAARWRAERGTNCMRMSRLHMVGDLRGHHLAIGMSTRDVRLLLGKPDYDIGVDLRGRGSWWSYLTGPDLVDCSTFDLRFKNSRLEETAIGQT
ncbi:MAG: hypothetical protein ACXVRE_08435 [Gaiellaceae bacterium]